MRNNGFGFKSQECLSGWAFPTRQDAEDELAKFYPCCEEIVPVVITTENEAQLRDEALDELIKLSSHYAELLNQYDGGKRIIFATADDWLKRLKDVNDAKAFLKQCHLE